MFLSELKTQCLFAASGAVSVGQGGLSAGLGAMQSWSARRVFTWPSSALLMGPITRPFTKLESVMALQIAEAKPQLEQTRTSSSLMPLEVDGRAPDVDLHVAGARRGRLLDERDRDADRERVRRDLGLAVAARRRRP